MRRDLRCITAAGLLIVAGCYAAPAENLPHVGPLPVKQTINLLNERAHATHTVSGEAGITFASADGKTVRLDGAAVLMLPTCARIRAWKFGQAVFDLTVNNDGVWVFTAQNTPPAGNPDRAIADWLTLLSGGFAGWQVAGEPPGRLLLSKPMDGGTARCEIDRTTVTARRFSFTDGPGHTRFQLLLGQYTMVNGIPWPRQVVVKSDRGSVEIDWREVQINGDVPAGAFVPPARAVRLAGGTR